MKKKPIKCAELNAFVADIAAKREYFAGITRLVDKDIAKRMDDAGKWSPPPLLSIFHETCERGDFSAWRSARMALRQNRLGAKADELCDREAELEKSYRSIFEDITKDTNGLRWAFVWAEAERFVRLADAVLEACGAEFKTDKTKTRTRYPKDAEAMKVLREMAKRVGRGKYNETSQTEIVREYAKSGQHRERLLYEKQKKRGGVRALSSPIPLEKAVKRWAKHLSDYLLHPPTK